MDLSNISGLIVQWIVNPLLWLIIIVGFILIIVAFLFIRKKRRLKYRVIEYLDLGNGRLSVTTDLKAGWFGKRLHLRGLWWSGEEVLRTNYGDIIHDFSTEDYQDIDGRRGVAVYRDPLRQDILVPINKATFKNKELVAAIAPSDYTDAATDIVIDSTKEVSDWRDKLIQFGGWALVVIFSLVAIIVIVQYVKAGQDKAAELLLESGKQGIENCREICKDTLNTILSSGIIK